MCVCEPRLHVDHTEDTLDCRNGLWVCVSTPCAALPHVDIEELDTFHFNLYKLSQLKGSFNFTWLLGPGEVTQ